MNVLAGEMERFKKSNFTVVFLGANKERTQKLSSVLADYDIEAAVTDSKKRLFRDRSISWKASSNQDLSCR